MTTDDFTAKQEYGFYLDGMMATGLPSVVGESLTGFVERIEAEAVRAAMAKLVGEVRGLQPHSMDGADCEWECVRWDPHDATTLSRCRFPDEHGDEMVSLARVLRLIEPK